MKPAWIDRGKTIAQLIRELSSFEDQQLEVRLSVDDGATTHPVSLVARLDGKCLLLHCAAPLRGRKPRPKK